MSFKTKSIYYDLELKVLSIERPNKILVAFKQKTNKKHFKVMSIFDTTL